jgi:S-methylmethionine-dependent homocysteine/selenocysteine methylase
MSIEVGGVNIKLEVDEYAHLMRTLGRLRDGNNDTLEQAIWTRYSSPGFQADPLMVQRDNIRDVYQGFTRAAQGELLTESKYSLAIQRRVEAAQRKALRR